MAFDEAAHQIKATGADLTGLGRWSWILFEGKSKHLTRIISVYVPHARVLIKGIKQCISNIKDTFGNVEYNDAPEN